MFHPIESQAIQLIQFMKQAENEQQLAHFIPTGLSNLAAIAALDPALKRDTPSNPANLQHAVELDVRFRVEHSEALTRGFDAWATVE